MQGSVHCPTCSRQIPVGDINIDRLVGRCTVCQKLFDIEEQGFGRRRSGPGVVSPSSEPEVAQRPHYSQPGSVTLRDDGRDCKFSIRWWSLRYVPLAIFCFVWDGFLIFWYSMMFLHFNLIGALFPIVHLGVGVFLTWSTLAGFLNSTEISVSADRFKLTHGPVPWKGALDMSPDELSQFFIVEKRGNKGSISHELCALLKDDSKIMVLSSSLPLDTLRYLEQELEAKLGIQDRRVLGEHAG